MRNVGEIERNERRIGIITMRMKAHRNPANEGLTHQRRAQIINTPQIKEKGELLFCSPSYFTDLIACGPSLNNLLAVNDIYTTLCRSSMQLAAIQVIYSFNISIVKSSYYIDASCTRYYCYIIYLHKVFC